MGFELVEAVSSWHCLSALNYSLHFRPGALTPLSDAHSDFTASKTVNRLVSMLNSRLIVKEKLTNTRRENARPLARFWTEVTVNSIDAKSCFRHGTS